MLIGCVTPIAFKTFSTFLELVAKELTNCPHITHYLDYFRLAGLTGSLEFRVPLARKKTVGLATQLTYLGIF